MKNYLSKMFRVAASVLLPTLVVASVAYAGSLTAPSGTPAAQSYTLGDIYTRLTTGAAAVAGNHALSTTTAPAASFYTLSQIYNAIPTVYPGDLLASSTYLGVTGSVAVKTGNTAAASSSAQGTSLVVTVPQGYYSGGASVTVSTSSANFTAANIANKVNLFGVTGTLLGNMWNGTGLGFTGGSQAAGGIDDYNNGGAASAGRYAGSWTQCTSGNNYCGTGSSGADWEDNSTGLVWSMPCSGTGCSTFSTATPGGYSWDNSGGVGTASALCSSHSGWSLPSEKQFMQAYIDGAYGNLEPVGVTHNYWTATTVSINTTSAWVVSLSYGYTNANAYATGNPIRCVR